LENKIKEILELVKTLHIKSDSLSKDNFRLQNQNNKILNRIDDLERDINNTPIANNQVLQNQYLSVKDILKEYPNIKKSTLYKILQNHQSNGLNVIQKDEGGTYTVQRKEWDFWLNNQLSIPNYLNESDNDILNILNSNHSDKVSEIEKVILKKEQVISDNKINFNKIDYINLSL
jgi:hypothetical protein